MTEQELAYAQFANLFIFDWYAQPDGGNKTVIFSYVDKSINSSKKFEAESLEKAFNYAFSLEGLIKVPKDEWRAYFGKITAFNHEKWNEQTIPDKIFSIGDNCWKKLSDLLEIEKQLKYEKAL